jgi:hypothetical protein
MTTATATALALLIEQDRVWSVEKLARELGGMTITLDAIAELQRDGLLNRINRHFVCASHAALRAEQLSCEAG